MSQELWKQLASFPFAVFSHPRFITNDEFIATSAKYRDYNGDGIYKFNKKKNEWSKIFNYDPNSKYNTNGASAYDKENQLLYISDQSHGDRTLQFDLRQKKFKSLPNTNWGCQLIFFEGKLHKIGGWSNSHYVYNKQNNEFNQIIYQFESFNCLSGSLVYLKSKKCMLSFGGRDLSGKFNLVWRFSCLDQKWQKLNVKMPNNMSHFGSVSTKNEKYIIILGGVIGSDNICIYDTKNNSFIKSNMQCPKKSAYYAIRSNDSKRDEILCFGYVSHCYKTQIFNGMQLLPFYLIQLISHYFSHEEIHLLEKYGTGAHWKINIDHILTSINNS